MLVQDLHQHNHTHNHDLEDGGDNIRESTESLLPTTVTLFPDIANLEDFFNDGEDETHQGMTIINEWALSKISTLQSKLEQMQHTRDAKFYRGNSGGFQKFSSSSIYQLANEVFGFNGWSTEILLCVMQEIRVSNEEEDDQVAQTHTTLEANSNNLDLLTRESSSGKTLLSGKRYSAKSLCLVKLVLLDGTCREDFGFGTATNVPSKHACFAKCKKEAVTDAIKNAILGLRDVYNCYELNQFF